jgi:hypothetical protein
MRIKTYGESTYWLISVLSVLYIVWALFIDDGSHFSAHADIFFSVLIVQIINALIGHYRGY